MSFFRSLHLSQRNYFNDLGLYGNHFNVVTYHGDNLTFVKSSDSLLVNCSFNNSKDLTSCIPLFSGENGFIVFKSHDASFYSYLSLTVTLIDDVMAYTASYDCHPALDGPGLYSDFLSQLRPQTASPYLESNLSQFVLLQHSVAARDLFARLYDGCSRDRVSYFAVEVGIRSDSHEARRQPAASGADAQLRDHTATLRASDRAARSFAAPNDIGCACVRAGAGAAHACTESHGRPVAARRRLLPCKSPYDPLDRSLAASECQSLESGDMQSHCRACGESLSPVLPAGVFGTVRVGLRSVRHPGVSYTATTNSAGVSS